MMGLSAHNSSLGRSTTSGMATGAGDARGTRYLPREAEEFPQRLRGVKPLAKGLWVEGRVPGGAESLIAVVGARAATRAGCGVGSRLAGELAAAGHGVVSGGALGVDAAAHDGALAAGGATFAILGCGIDVIYPDRHRRLYRAIAASGGLLSEYGPGVPVRSWQFPVRNRLVAALADAVVVAECWPRSGALITAQLARRLGRPLLALAGSPGADSLLATGAALPIQSAADVRAALAGTLVPASGGAGQRPDPWGEICAAVGRGPAGVEDVALKLRIPVAEVLAVLCEAEMAGRLRRLPGGRYEVCRGN
jgi:DNA processing protein